MAKRVGLSNKLRFEVFKRDSFKCQYCGKCAPDVILNVDHISPVSKGGKNDILNLITSCFDCNSGKSDRLLSDNSVLSIQRKQLDELSQRREQLDMLIMWKKVLSDKSYEIDSIVGFFNDKNNSSISLTECGIKSLKVLIKKYTIENILDAINTAYDKYTGVEIEEMWNKIPSVLSFITASESDRNKMKFFGGVKARYIGTGGYSQWAVINTNRLIKKLFEVVDIGDDTILTYSDLFKVLNSSINYRDFQYDIDKLYNQFYE